jgi:hypothetical protein
MKELKNESHYKPNVKVLSKKKTEVKQSASYLFSTESLGYSNKNAQVQERSKL